MCLNIGTLNNQHIPFGTNEKVVVLGVPKLKHFRVYGTLGIVLGVWIHRRSLKEPVLSF